MSTPSSDVLKPLWSKAADRSETDQPTSRYAGIRLEPIPNQNNKGDDMQDLGYSWEPVVAVFADDQAGLVETEASVTAAGARIGARGTIADALARLDGQSADAVMVRVSGQGSEPAFARLLDRLNDDAAAGRGGSVVVFPRALIDLAMKCAPHDDVALVCGGSRSDELVALSMVLAPRAPLVLEERNDENPAQLRKLREEVGRIARTLAEMSGEEPRGPAAPAMPAAGKEAGTEKLDGAFLRSLIRNRRLRAQFFAPDLFADPAWDMLIDLMLARTERRLVAVSSLCIAAAVPPTTALRWIKRLTDEGLFVRSADPRDGRRVYIDLSEDCAARMTAYLGALAYPGFA